MVKFRDVLRSAAGLFDIFKRGDIKRLQNEVALLRQSVKGLEREYWVPIGSAGEAVVPRERFVKMVKLSREYYRNNPYYRQAIRLYSAFIFGRGASITSNDEGIQQKLDVLINTYDNQKTFFSPIAQIRLSNKLLRDGELFVFFFVSPDNQVIIRICDPLEIEEIITEPDDQQTELYYKRAFRLSKSFGGELKRLVYRSVEYFDYTNYPYAIPAMMDLHSPETDDCYVMHVVSPETDILEQRGTPPLLSSVEWARLHMETIQDFVAYLRAITMIVAKEVVKDAGVSVEEIKRQIEGLQGEIPRFATRIEFEGGDEYQPVERSGNLASVFERVARATKLSVCAGTGIYEHYFGDPSTGNLATATSMELPMIKIFEQWQRFWESVYRDVIAFYLKLQGIDEVEAMKSVEVKFPDFLKKDAPGLLNGVINAYSMGIIDGRTAARIVLSLLAYDKIDEALKIWEDEAADSSSGLKTGMYVLDQVRQLRRIIETIK
ncbi:MAG: hypothetical protein ABIK73_06675 [candidate division WOR-3 bacterium]